MREMHLADLSTVDFSKWTHPVSQKLVMTSNNDRGKFFEKFTALRIKECFQEFQYVNYLEVNSQSTTGRPDIAFKSTLNEKEKYVEVKSVQQKIKKDEIHYTITRLKPFDDGEKGNKNFDYLVIGYIHPTRGVIVRSMTHEECVKAIKQNIFKYVKSWKGYAFNINDFENFTHTQLKMYENLSCIKGYEKRTVFSLWGVDVDMPWLKKSLPIESNIK